MSSLTTAGSGAGAARKPAMVPATRERIVRFPAELKPQLLVIVDAEESFEWSAPFSRTNFRVDTSATQGRSNRIFERYGIKPTYAVDFPVALDPSGYRPLLELMQSG